MYLGKKDAPGQNEWFRESQEWKVFKEIYVGGQIVKDLQMPNEGE